jgi:hypothetical protein
VLPHFAEAFFDDNSSYVNFNDFISELQVLQAGLKKPAEFFEIRQKPVEPGRSEFQNRKLLFTVSKFQKKKIKVSKKYVKKN